LDGLYRMLAEVLVDPDHQLRKTVEEGLEKLAHDLVHDPQTRAKVEATKREILANPAVGEWWTGVWERLRHALIDMARNPDAALGGQIRRSEEHTSELQSRENLVCRLLLEKKK